MIRFTSHFVALCGVFIATSSIADTVEHKKHQLDTFMNNMAGNWDCNGGTSRGTETAANLTFSKSYDENVYLLIQQGTKGHTNKLGSSWAYDLTHENLVVSRRYITDKGATIALFTGASWTENSLVLEAKALWKPLWADNRFTYQLSDSDHLKITWELKKESWKMGDYLNCTRI